MDRHCARPGCSRAAEFSLTYDYKARSAWLDDLTPETHPSVYDLCSQHADHLRVPNGWQRHDRRAQARAAALLQPPLAS